MDVRTVRRSAALLLVGAVILGACGGGAGAPAAASPTATAVAAASPTASPTLGPVAPIKIAVTSLTIGNAVTYVAIAQGFFKQAGVDVTTIDNASTNLLNLVVSGQADLGQGSMTNPLTATAQGKPMTIIFDYQGNAAGGFLAGKNEYTSPTQIKKVGSGGPGTSIFGYCNVFKAALKATWDCIPMADYTTRKAAFLSGQIDGVMDVYAQLFDLVEKGQAKALIDTRDPKVRRMYLKEDTGDAGIWGLTETMTAKKESVARFMKGIAMAVQYINSHTDAEVAASVLKNPQFATFQQDALAAQEKNYRDFNHPNNGYITEASWVAALQNFALWGLGDDINSRVNLPVFSYQQRVDMTFLANAGIKGQ
jgi:ABC-type nitrate/sulfonate/bicarbonate transport system substrate-binding protein